MADRVCIIRQRDYYELPVRREAESLRDAGFEVDIICLQQEGHPPVEEDNGVRLYRLPLHKKKASILRYFYDYFSFLFLAFFKVTQLHLRHRYRVIQVNTMPDFLVFATLIPRLLGAKIIVFMKEPTPELAATLYNSSLLPRLLRVMEQTVLKYVHLAFTVTQQQKELYVARGANSSKIHVVLNGPDASHLLQYKNGLAPDPNYFTLICHGAVEDRYGQDIILEAVKLAKQAVPNLRLRLVGTGAAADRVQELIRELGVGDYVDYLGWVSMQRLVDELSQADVGIVAQKSSPYSNLVHTNKMYEYIIFGKPAILSRLDSVSRYFDDQSMYYFEPSNPRSLADAIVDLYRHPEKGESRLHKARTLYKQYSWDAQKQTYLGGYHQLVGKADQRTSRAQRVAP